MELMVNDLNSVIAEFNSKYKVYSDGRYASFDYCYNYFQRTKDLTEDIEKSCLVLGFYLASWGMFRGSSFLLEKSVKHFKPTIEYISKLDKSVWQIDVDNYDSNIETILNIYKEVQSLLVQENCAHLTLTTKTLLGVFGFVPAFDKFFCNTFRRIADGRCGFRELNKTSLTEIKNFYEANKHSIDNISKQTFTTNFSEGKTEIHYPKAKIIDMYGFTVGYDEFTKNNNAKIGSIG